MKFDQWEPLIPCGSCEEYDLNLRGLRAVDTALRAKVYQAIGANDQDLIETLAELADAWVTTAALLKLCQVAAHPRDEPSPLQAAPPPA